ncbi:phosphate uptake regulator PhoU [Pyrofollis japonicus]|uniref:phosphate signaling complex PhoU family protein n=1 Tax=Pyrofollis japonicus TaxID=3060460 RepID=UPI00295B84C8|nr:phosphate uptake regulator PhoU [Pyrofollis japonicus]BEP17184.1 phosphate uptake regulator PhoU [Pyrofollis japonicus]
MASTITRRVQLVGGSTFVVSLPKEWARQVGVRAGSELEIEILPDGSLVLRPKSSSSSRKALSEYIVEIGEDSDFNMIVRRIMAGYLAGFKSIRLVKKSPALQKQVEEIIDIVHKRILGLEPLEEDTSSVLLQNIVDTSFAEIKSSLRRLARVTITMHEDVLQCMYAGRECTEIFRSIRERDNLADKLYLLVLRQLVEATIDPSEAARQRILLPETLFIASIAKNIERIADYATVMSRILVDTESRVPSEICEVYNDAIGVLKMVLRAVIEEGNVDIEDASKKSDIIKKRIKELRSSSGHGVPLSTGLILETLSRIIAHTIDIVEALIDVEAVKQAFSRRGEVAEQAFASMV